ncbi:hypothetical protein [Roseibium sp. RKSG952]|uniref:hypothetical protein n=1 Tax=Roseibium sp. RKSG952 TaxID=2529384 RepID=UPI0012BBE49B|nr:hypothetical protein [Roseibium sp. RKSG952]
MVETERPGAQRTSGSNRAAQPANVLKQVIEGYLEVVKLQQDYQALYKSLPSVAGIAGEILKRKEETDRAMAEAHVAVEKVIREASEKADALSKSMAEQHSLLEQVLGNKEVLDELLKAGKEGMSMPNAGGAGLGGGLAGGLASGLGRPDQTPAGGADPKIAFQLNTMMGNIQAMVSREVERQLAALRAQAERTIKNATDQ